MIFLPPFHFIWRLALICLLTLLLIIVGCFMSCRWGLGEGEGLRSIFTTSIYVFVCLFIVCECACLCVSVCLQGIHGIYTEDSLQVSVITFQHLDPWDRSRVIRFGRKSLGPIGPSHLPFQVFPNVCVIHTICKLWTMKGFSLTSRGPPKIPCLHSFRNINLQQVSEFVCSCLSSSSSSVLTSFASVM